jgi:hypothetical protein
MRFLERAEGNPDEPRDDLAPQSYAGDGILRTDDAPSTGPVHPAPRPDRALLAALDQWRPPVGLTQPVRPVTEVLPLREAARRLVRDTREGRALEAKLDAFDTLDDAARMKAAPGIRKDLADIVARAVTEEHQRRALLDALATVRNDPALAASGPAQRQEQHPVVPQLVDVVEDILAALGKEMLIEALLPGAHVLLPPSDFVDSLFTAVTLLEIAHHPAEIDDPWDRP